MKLYYYFGQVVFDLFTSEVYNENNDGFFFLTLPSVVVRCVWEHVEIKSAAEDTNGKIPEPNQKSVLCECRLPVIIFVHKIQLYYTPTICCCVAINKHNSLHNHFTATIYILSKCNYKSPLSPRSIQLSLYNMPEITQHYVKLSILLRMC